MVKFYSIIDPIFSECYLHNKLFSTTAFFIFVPYSLYDYIVIIILDAHICVFLSLLLWLLKKANVDNEGFSSPEIRVTNVFLIESRPCYVKGSGIFNNAYTSVRAMGDVYSIFTARKWWVSRKWNPQKYVSSCKKMTIFYLNVILLLISSNSSKLHQRSYS